MKRSILAVLVLLAVKGFVLREIRQSAQQEAAARAVRERMQMRPRVHTRPGLDLRRRERIRSSPGGGRLEAAGRGGIR